MAEDRKDKRHSKRLRAVIIIDENGRQSKTHGKTQDISVSGASIISDYNLVSKHPITVCLLLHPGDKTNPPVVVEAKSRIACTILSPQQGGFRIGVEFVSLEGDGAKLLKKFLAASLVTTS